MYASLENLEVQVKTSTHPTHSKDNICFKQLNLKEWTPYIQTQDFFIDGKKDNIVRQFIHCKTSAWPS